MKKRFLSFAALLLAFAVVWGQNRVDETYIPPLEEPNLRYADGMFQQMAEGDLLVRSGRHEEAILLFDNLINQYPNIPEVYIKRGMVKYLIGRMTEARQDFSAADRLNPYAGDLYGHLGKNRRLNVLSLDYVSPTPVAEALDESIEESGRAQSLLAEAQRQIMDGRWLEALPGLNAAVEESRERDPLILKMRGNVSLLLDRHLAAISDYNKAIQLAPESAPLYYNRGLAKLLIYDRSGACRDFEESVRLGYERGLEKLKFFCSF